MTFGRVCLTHLLGKQILSAWENVLGKGASDNIQMVLRSSASGQLVVHWFPCIVGLNFFKPWLQRCSPRGSEGADVISVPIMT